MKRDTPDRFAIAAMIAGRLRDDQERARQEFSRPERVPTFVIDNLLPADLALRIHAASTRIRIATSVEWRFA